MESLHQMDHQTILTRFSKYSEQIPDDLINEIHLRLPSRSIARFRCVSKLWDSAISGQDFTKSFLTRSSSRPQILFACGQNNVKLFLSSSPQPQNTEENSSSIAANYHMSLRCGRFCTLGHISSLVYVRKDMYLWKICNPSTGQCFTLPEVEKRYSWIRTFFGCDLIEKQVKVLTITGEHGGDKAHQVLTILETDKMSWRRIECGTSHSPIFAGVCISGVLYYRAYKHSSSDACMMIVCFDVRAEKYSFVRVSESSLGAMDRETSLINYNGKLASLKMRRSFGEASSTSFDMWVPQDSEKLEEWSKHTYKFPMSRNEEAIQDKLYFIVVPGKKEIVLFPKKVSHPFYVFYYNLEKETSRRVEIQGMKEVKGKKVFAYLDHLEDLKLM